VLAQGGVAQDRTLVLHDVTVVSTQGGPSRSHVDVTIVGGRVASVEASGKPTDPSSEVLHVEGGYVIPGLVDMHAHVHLAPRSETGGFAPGPDAATTKRVLRLLLAEGVTTIRDPGAPTEAAVALREGVRSGRITGPRIFTAGRILNSEASGPEFVAVSSGEAACREIAVQASAGVDFVKLYSGLGPTVVAAAISCAHARGLRVIGHLQATTWTEAALDKIDFLCHTPWSAEYLAEADRAAYPRTLVGRTYWLRHVDLNSASLAGLIEALRAQGTPVDPTLIAMHTKFWGNSAQYLESPENPAVPTAYLQGWPMGSFTRTWTPPQYAEAQREWPRLLSLVKAFFDGGVTLLAGTDTPTPWIVPGVSLHQELALLHAAGIPNGDVLKIATYNAARALRRPEPCGSVAPGADADLLVLLRDPLEDLENTRSIRLVIAGGRVFNPRELAE
jgi:imidazolonepropionase-like amidohydrolase